MKKINYLVFFASLLFFQCQNKNTEISNGDKVYSSIAFATLNKNIGEIKADTSILIDFYAVNTSKNPLIIDTVSSSCSCTASLLKKKVVSPNDSILIQAKYTPKKKYRGVFEQSLVVSANTNPAFTVLKISGIVID